MVTRASDLDKSKLAGKVSNGLTGNINLADPPVKPPDLDLLKGSFDNLIIKAAGGGTLITAQKDAAGAALVNALDKDASYVDIHCNEDITILLRSGYDAVSTNRAQTVLDAPLITDVSYGQTSETSCAWRVIATARRSSAGSSQSGASLVR